MGVSHTWASCKQVSSLNLQVSSKSKSFFVTIKQVKSSHSFGQASHKSSHTKVSIFKRAKDSDYELLEFYLHFLLNIQKTLRPHTSEEFKLTHKEKHSLKLILGQQQINIVQYASNMTLNHEIPSNN